MFGIRLRIRLAVGIVFFGPLSERRDDDAKLRLRPDDDAKLRLLGIGQVVGVHHHRDAKLACPRRDYDQRVLEVQLEPMLDSIGPTPTVPGLQIESVLRQWQVWKRQRVGGQADKVGRRRR